MPTYDYKCDNCGYQYEVFQSMKDKLLKKCPECNENKLRRLIGGGGGLIFKGSGFYLTDYKNKSSEASKTSKDTSGKSKTEKKDTTSEKSASGSKAEKSAPAKEK